MCTIGLRAGLALLIFSWTTIGLAQAPQRAERPVVKVGDSPVYRDLTVRTGEKRDTTFAVIMMDADRIVTETAMVSVLTRS